MVYFILVKEEIEEVLIFLFVLNFSVNKIKTGILKASTKPLILYLIDILILKCCLCF